MNGSRADVPAMRVTTTTIADPGEVIRLLDPQHPLAFLRDGNGLVGIGEALRLEFSGPSRFRDASARWRSLVAAATIRDEVGVAGSGLAAFGSFAFADDSAESSVLIVPRVLLGRRGGTTWMTTVSATEQTNDAARVDDSARNGRPAQNDTTDAGPTRDPTAHPPHSWPEPVPFGAEFTARFTAGRVAPAAYRDSVVAAVGRIAAGEAQKVVLARDVVGTVPDDADLRRVLVRLADGYPQAFTFAVDRMIGASPETLVRVHSGLVTARVLAGTAARGGDVEGDRRAASALKASAKDVAEHDFAVTSVLDALRPHCGDVRAREAFTLRLPNLWHLASEVEGTLDDGADALALLDGLHPTAAVAGTPTADAVRLISSLEPFDRGRYAGPVGWVDGAGNGTWAIALRCARVDAAGRVTAFAGAGIVPGSDPDAELAETDLKLRPVVEAFG